MKPNDLIKTLINEQGITQAILASKLGMKSASQLSVALRSDMRISTYIRIIEELGGTVTVNTPDGISITLER